MTGVQKPDVAQPGLTSLGHTMDQSPEAFGWLADSRSLLDKPVELRERMEIDGYVYLTDVLDAALVEQSRLRMLEQLHELGMLHSESPIREGMARMPWNPRSCHDLIHGNESLRQLLYSGRMLEIFRHLFAAEVRHFDFTWLRVIGPGKGTAPHADSVYMNRGTSRLLTAWTPLMEIPLDVGGLMVMPGSHRIQRLRKYFDSDVDTVCENRRPRHARDVHQWIGPMGDGKLSENPAVLQKKLQLPWLTAERFQPGDVLIFSIYTLHGSLDNISRRVRLSSDSRYQPSNEPADHRWIGPNPTGHSTSNRRALIC